MPHGDSKWLNPEQAAERLNMSRRQLDRMRKRGEGPKYFEFSERIRRYSADDLDAFIEESRRTPAAG